MKDGNQDENLEYVWMCEPVLSDMMKSLKYAGVVWHSMVQYWEVNIHLHSIFNTSCRIWHCWFVGILEYATDKADKLFLLQYLLSLGYQSQGTTMRDQWCCSASECGQEYSAMVVLSGSVAAMQPCVFRMCLNRFQAQTIAFLLHRKDTLRFKQFSPWHADTHIYINKNSFCS